MRRHVHSYILFEARVLNEARVLLPCIHPFKPADRWADRGQRTHRSGGLGSSPVGHRSFKHFTKFVSVRSSAFINSTLAPGSLNTAHVAAPCFEMHGRARPHETLPDQRDAGHFDVYRCARLSCGVSVRPFKHEIDASCMKHSLQDPFSISGT